MSKDLSDTSNRKKLKKSSFALPEEEKYPIPDIDHARNALARVAQHGTAGREEEGPGGGREEVPEPEEGRLNAQCSAGRANLSLVGRRR